MSITEAFSFAELTLKTAFSNTISDFITNKHKLEQCLALLSDRKSQINYQSEVSFLMLKGVNEVLARKISPFTDANWKNDVVAKWESFLKSDACPKMVCPEKELGYLANMLMTTYIANQYQYDDLVKVDKGDIFIDGGACFGDTALWAYHHGAKEVYSFEPSPYNFNILKDNIKANERDVEKCFNLAVGNEKCSIPFAAAPGMAGASHATKNGNIMVDCVRIDDFVKEHNIKPTFLKLDIEGFEMGALNGAIDVITKYKPKLTICLYHKISDMWEIPLFIHSLVADYKFYCRKNNVANEFILYAVKG